MKQQCHGNGNCGEVLEEMKIGNFRAEWQDDGILLNAVERNFGVANGAGR